MLDNDQKHNTCNNVLSSQNFSSYLLIIATVLENKKEIYDNVITDMKIHVHR
jgi:hypothetical protein